MSDKDLSMNPHKIRGMKTAWWYEEEKGICLVVEPHDTTQLITIPWDSLRFALKRKDKP